MKNVPPASALWYHHSRNKHGGSNWIGGPFVEFSKLNCITARQIKPKSQKLCWNAHMAPEDFFSIFVALGYVSLFYSYSNFKCIFLSCEMHSLNFPWGKLKALIYGQLCANLHVCTYRTNNNCSCGLDLEVEMYCPWFSFLEHKICFPFWKKVNAPSATGYGCTPTIVVATVSLLQTEKSFHPISSSLFAVLGSISLAVTLYEGRGHVCVAKCIFACKKLQVHFMVLPGFSREVSPSVSWNTWEPLPIRACSEYMLMP